MRILSLGAGVQSSCLFLMSCGGAMPRIDAAIFADTGWEPAEVYDWLHDTLLPASERSGIPIHTVSAGNLREDALNSTIRGKRTQNGRWASLPLRVTSDSGGGMLRRQCTREYKLDPIKRKCRELLGVSPHARIAPGMIEMWLGISADEASRMAPSRVQYITNRWPLIEREPPMRRSDCLAWIQGAGYGVPPKSACNGCPYRSDTEFLHLKLHSPADWADAVEVDEAIRHRDARGGEAFIHRSLTPLRDAVLTDPTPSLWDDECSGICGV